jgi:predicted protein tyrosine phosphatase
MSAIRVCFMSEAAAIALLPSPTAAMISITEPGRTAPLPAPNSWGALLRVEFVDAEYDEPMIRRLRARSIRFDPDSKGFPCARTSHAIRCFLGGLRDHPEITDLMVHCHAGQRRSAAVAQFAAVALDGAMAQQPAQMNRTVYLLLTDPDRFAAEAAPGAHRWLGVLGRLFAIRE